MSDLLNSASVVQHILMMQTIFAFRRQIRRNFCFVDTKSMEDRPHSPINCESDVVCLWLQKKITNFAIYYAVGINFAGRSIANRENDYTSVFSELTKDANSFMTRSKGVHTSWNN